MNVLLLLSLVLGSYATVSAFQVVANRRSLSSSVLRASSPVTSIDEAVGNVIILLPEQDSTSNFGPSLHEIAETLSQILTSDHQIEATVAFCNSEYDSLCQDSNVLIALGVQAPVDVRFVATLFRKRRAASVASSASRATCQFALGGKPFAPLVDNYDEANPSLLENFPWTVAAQDKILALEMQRLFGQWETEDFVVALTLFFDAKRNSR
jgi:hypothetical protein